MLQVQSREVEAVARINGEEFAILMPDVDAAGAAGYAERLRHAVQQMKGPHGTVDRTPEPVPLRKWEVAWYQAACRANTAGG